MRVDTSEVKSRNKCPREWFLTSRNGLNLIPKSPNPNFLFGTLIHNALHAMYLSSGKNVDAAIETCLSGLSDPADQRVAQTMLVGYATEILPADLAEFTVIDVEHGFKIPLAEFHPAFADFGYSIATGEIIEICGSLDMLAVRNCDNTLWVFEHKTCRSFRDDTYMMIDEQPRTYFEALMHYIAQHPEKEYVPGGVFINELKKTVKFFSQRRTACTYSVEEREAFRLAFGMRVYRCQTADSTPQPDFIKCASCAVKDICAHYGYNDAGISAGAEEVLKEFGEEFEVRAVDHLDEKEALKEAMEE